MKLRGVSNDRFWATYNPPATNENPTMSLLIRPNAEQHWRLPLPDHPVVERSWGSWTPLELLPSPRGTKSLPEGEYAIRYRVRGFI